MAQARRRRDPLLPWWSGLLIILAAVGFVGYRMWATDCQLQGPLVFGVLAIVPIVYLALMFLTFISQD